jgi:uncharacterized protein
MKIELRRASEDFSQKQDLQASPEALKLEAEGVAFEDPVQVELTLTKNREQLICRGKITASVRLECSRCLAEYRASLLSDLAFVIDLGENSGQEESEEEGYYLADPAATEFEIDDLVREAVLLSIPLKPLCSEECKGLCPSCGVDLNRSRCNCARESVDPRWDRLRGLLKNKS